MDSEDNPPVMRGRSKSAMPLTEEEKKERKRARNHAYRAKSENKLKDAQRKRDQRAQMSEAEKQIVQKKDRDYKTKMRQKLTKEESFNENSDDEPKPGLHERERRAKALEREQMTEAEAEFDRLQLCIRMRKLRMKRNGKEHLLDNLVAKKGMRQFREFGYLKAFQERSPRALDDETLWYRFWCRGKEQRALLRSRLGDLAKKFTEKEEKERKEYEKKREEEEKRRKIGYWDYNPCDDCYYWTGDGPSPCSFEEYNGLGEYAPVDMRKLLMEMSPEEKRKRKELDDKRDEEYRSWWNEMVEEERLERNRKAKEKRDQIKEQLSTPFELPESEEMSEYEKIREANIAELEELKKASGLFDDK